MPRKVKSGEPFKVYAQQFAVENKNATDASVKMSIDGETFYDTEFTASAKDLTLCHVGGPQLFFKLEGQEGDEYSIGG